MFAQAGTAESSLRDGFIEKIPLLASLEKYERFKIQEALIQQTFAPPPSSFLLAVLPSLVRF